MRCPAIATIAIIAVGVLAVALGACGAPIAPPVPPPAAPLALREGPILKGHKNSVRRVAFSPDGRTLASGGDDATLQLWTAGG